MNKVTGPLCLEQATHEIKSLYLLKPLYFCHTGRALSHIQYDLFQPNKGMRSDSQKILILITDGESQDDVSLDSQRLRDDGIEIYTIGVKNVNETQLRTIASDPDEIHMFSVIDSSFLLDIVANLTINLCNSANSLGRQRVCYHQTVIHVNTTLICWCQN
ncbi:collagen alpha-1(XII) chain-like [Thunnus albacares]|uniref:collagen alpha-1(XII) chain-like n=1 Tax=Thunnus albacares TaxID=8236 RepID=UPI001CF6F171|nr:collagen alpha-1(XII) chain-like [Thunnus albacares]